MVQLITTPPPPEAIGRLIGIEGVSVSPGILAVQQGPDRHLGPEAAGAILVLQATFVDEAKFGEFWQSAIDLMELLADASGFIRRYNFTDAGHYTLIAFWRTMADAQAFFEREEHQAAMGELFRNRWQYSHFASLWECPTPRRRLIFCQHCDAVNPSSESTCPACGTEIEDPYVTAAAPVP